MKQEVVFVSYHLVGGLTSRQLKGHRLKAFSLNVIFSWQRHSSVTVGSLEQFRPCRQLIRSALPTCRPFTGSTDLPLPHCFELCAVLSSVLFWAVYQFPVPDFHKNIISSFSRIKSRSVPARFLCLEGINNNKIVLELAADEDVEQRWELIMLRIYLETNLFLFSSPFSRTQG